MGFRLDCMPEESATMTEQGLLTALIIRDRSENKKILYCVACSMVAIVMLTTLPFYLFFFIKLDAAGSALIPLNVDENAVHVNILSCGIMFSSKWAQIVSCDVWFMGLRDTLVQYTPGQYRGPALTPAREGDKPQSPARKAEPHQSPAREAEQDQSPAKGGDYTLLPPSSPGDHMLLPPPLLPPQEPEGEELQAPPPENFWGGEGQDAGVPQQPLFMLLKAARRAPAQPPQRREPAPPGAEELELPLSPPPPGAEELELPLSPPLPGAEELELPLPPPPPGAEELELPLPPPPPGAEEQELPLPPPPPGAEEQELPLPPPPPGAEEQELPLPLRRPSPNAALSLVEGLWPEPHQWELPATKKGEVGGPPAPAAISLQEGTSMLSAVPLPAGVPPAWPARGPQKPPFPARDYVLDCWIFKGGGGR
ncbi:UNVERIFIED_CONTAM: hypothetical protein FKN15_073224 [Acipenser sinensis]